MSILKKIGSFFNSKFFLIFCIVCFLYIQGTQSDHFFKWINPHKVVPERSLTIHTDGAGYYAYLPQWFIYHDDYQFLEKVTTKYNTPYFISGVRYNYDEHTGVNKYYIGTAIYSAPLFLINHSINKLSNKEADGYSRSYQLTVSLNALLYWLFGVIALILLLKKWKLQNFWIALTIAILTFGTNLNFYTVYFPSFSHVFSFAAISWFIYMAVLWAENKKVKYFITICFLAGLIFLIRPTNILIVFIIPFLFKDWKEFLHTLKLYLTEKKKVVFLGLFLFLLMLSFQLLSVYSQIGQFKLNTYQDEHFDFLFDPQIFNVLFSYRKGFFVYAPIMILMPLALIYMFKIDTYKAFGISIVSLLFLYLTSSWWCWWYGGGLGMRPFIDILVLLAIPIALLLKYSNSIVRFGILGFALGGIWVYQTYQIQYHLNIIAYDGMTNHSFWKVFMKTDMRYAWTPFFHNEYLPKTKPLNERKFYLQPESKQFVQTKTNPGVIIYEFVDEANPGITFIPDSSWNDSKIGIMSKGYIAISQSQSNPNVHIIYYNNGREMKNFESYIGPEIDELNVLSPYQLEFFPGLTYGKVDSIRVNIGKSDTPTKMKDIEVTFYSFPSKN